MDANGMTHVTERALMGRIMVRLLPLLAAMFLVNNIDRVNISFAALTMNPDLGLSTLAYAWGAGIFFVAYFLFEVPSNLIMERVGARRWMTRIMASWGLVSGAMAFASGETSFYVLRFLLGAAEAGLLPGMMLYITYWFPPRYRARAIGLFIVTAPLSYVFAGLLSVPLLGMDGIAGLAGWQWLFLVQAAPTLLLAVVVWFLLPDRPRDARWMSAAEAAWVEANTQVTPHADVATQLRALLDRRVALLSIIYITRTTAMYGISLFLPLIVKGMGLSNAQTGVVSVIPFLFATGGLLLWSYNSDRTGERHWHAITAMVLATAGLAAAAGLGPSVWALVAISVAAIGLYAQPVPFWALVPTMLSTAAVGSGMAIINSIGNLGGFVGPYAVGWIQHRTDSYIGGLYLLAACAFASGVLSILLLRLRWDEPDLQRDPSRLGLGAGGPDPVTSSG
jgi:MFS transporter, ACS family, tartrate transporter